MRSKIDDEEVGLIYYYLTFKNASLNHPFQPVDYKDCSVFVTAALLKDFLRSLPDSLLPSDTFSIWNDTTKDANANEKVSSSKR